LLSASLITLLSSVVILSVICSWLANGLGRVASVPVVVPVPPALMYPIVGEVLKSFVIVDMIRFSADLMALLSPAIV
jgi:hypothetical protein